MALAKKFTRRIVVNGEPFLWYFRDNSLDCETGRRVAVQHETTPGQLLVADPFYETYAQTVEIRPQTIRDVILFGLAQGWTPKEKANPLFVTHDGVNWKVGGRAEASVTA